MRYFRLAATALALVVLAACGAPVTNVKLDTPAPPTPSASTDMPTVAPASASFPAPTDTATPAQAPSSSPASTAATESPIVSPAGGPAWRAIISSGQAPSAREDHTWTVDGDGAVAYLFGGRTADGPSNELWSFDLATNAWTQLQPDGASPVARFGHTATWVDDMGLVVWSGQGRDSFFADLNLYNPAANTWTELSSLGAAPDARYGSCASLGPDGELWISHGFTAEGRFSDTRSYDFTTGTWTDRTPVGDVPTERCLHDCFWANDRLILYGGQTNGVAALGDIWAYDVATGTWSQGPEPEAPARQLYALAASTEYGTLVFGGGSADGGYLDDTSALDWGALALHPLDVRGPSARSGATLVIDGQHSRYLLFGGKNADGLLDDTWQLFTSP
jgi:hypothetical protein